MASKVIPVLITVPMALTRAADAEESAKILCMSLLPSSRTELNFSNPRMRIFLQVEDLEFARRSVSSFHFFTLGHQWVGKIFNPVIFGGFDPSQDVVQDFSLDIGFSTIEKVEEIDRSFVQSFAKTWVTG